MASSASCHRSSSLTSAEATWNSGPNPLTQASPWTTWRFAFNEPLSGKMKNNLGDADRHGMGHHSFFMNIGLAAQYDGR